MGRFVILAAVAVLLAAAYWFVSANGDSPPAPPHTPAATPAVATAPAPAAASTADAAQAERTSAPAPDAASEVPPLPADAQWVDVLVVDKATGKPVAEADAIWVDQAQHLLVAKLPPAERDAAYRDRELIAQRFGWRGRSDREGKLRVTLGKGNTQVFARAGTRFGQALVRLEDDSKDARRVLLEEDATVRVRVLDAASRPVAGVPVSLEIHDEKQTRAMHIGGELLTGADGMATFRHVQSRRTYTWGERSGQPVAQWRLWIGIPGIDLAPVLVDAQAPPADPIEVRLPPTGRLRAKLTFNGRPLPGLEYMSFHAGPKDDPEGSNSAWVKRVDDDGWVRFHAVPLGKPLFVTWNRHGNWDLEVAGPTVAEQEVVASFELADGAIALVGRLLRADGTPLASAGVQGNFDAWRSQGGCQVNTDETGRFVWLLGLAQPEFAKDQKLRRLVLELRAADAATQRVEVPPRDLEVGSNDLGDLRFGLAPLIVGGHFVFDTPGTPRPLFQLQRAKAAPARGGEAEPWEGVQGVQPEVREDGAFEARGTVAPGRYRLVVRPNGFLPVDPVEFAVGASDLTIAIRRGAQLAVTCLLPNGLDARSVSMRLRRAGDSTSPRQDTGGPFDPLRGHTWAREGATLKFRWPALENGTYSLVVEAPGFAEPLLVLADVVVPAPANGDPRLDPLDLRELVGTLLVRIPSGLAEGTRVLVFPQPQADDRVWDGFEMGRELRIAVPKRPVDLLFAASERRPTMVRGAVDVVDVTLEPWPRVELRVLGADALPAGVQLRAYARSPGKPEKPERQYRTANSGGGLSLYLAAPTSAPEVKDGVAMLTVGEGVSDLAFWVALDPRGRPTPLKKFTPNQIVAGAPVTVHLDADELRAAIEKLQQDAPSKK